MLHFLFLELREHQLGERYFSQRVMAEEYVRVYGHLAETGELPAGKATPWS